MSTGDTAPPAVVTALLPPPTASESTMSSPLSEVKDADPDEMDEDHLDHLPQKHDASDSTSNLSDIHSDPPESEAETDRLFDTPQKPAHHKDVFVNHNNEAKIFERSPSKLQQELILKDGPSKDGAACRSPSHSPLQSPCSPSFRPTSTRPTELESPTKPQKEPKQSELATDGAESDTKKRKRSMAPDDSDSDAPLRKRTGSVQAVEKETISTEASAPDEATVINHEPSDGHSTVEDEGATPSEKKKAEPPKLAPTEEPDQVTPDTSKSKRKRGSTRKRRSPVDTDNTDVYHAHDTHDDEVPPVAEEDATHGADDDHMDVDGDHEVDIAHKNEEELEKKRLAYGQLAAIEKHFAAFRDRLYEERLEQLNQEEAMLRGETPTHPEYLAMMQCVDARLQEQLQHSESHLKHDVESLDTWAVSRRGQIMSQYHQGVRASRERTLSELGKQWFEIQYERRRRADSTPDFGIKFPVQRPQQIRQAVAYNKEVSILSGVAKYQGFPAAPELNGAAASEVEDDFDAITRAQQPITSVVHQFHEYGISNRVLGPAGEQFIEQTPWANPNHPSHHTPRNPSIQAESAPLPRRQLSQQNPFGMHGSVPGLSNGQSNHKPNARQQHYNTDPSSGNHAEHPVGHPKGGGKAASDMAVKPDTLTQAAVV
ncbi:hypothetical protein MKZ38_009301 [Zalerion maritima]|uniref:Transcriptional regulatory protein DEP1 n=1 Tax=Zalerion maritima TaxID=339359 RepID=A0AAD5RUN9_9PEZI|nr:hypothetical protein MKZ38_009301 [Zalerion maritima]